MKDGFLKVAAAAPQVALADPGANAKAIIGWMEKAREQRVKLLALPELCLTGASCGDLFFQQALLDSIPPALEAIRAASEGSDLVIAVGAPLQRTQSLYNCIIFIQNGKFLAVVPKTMPRPSRFDRDSRWFVSAPSEDSEILLGGEAIPFGGNILLCCENLPGLTVTAGIGTGLWAPHPLSGQHTCLGATVIVNPYYEPETAGRAQYRRQMVSAQSAMLCAVCLCAGAGEGESAGDSVCGGHNIIAETGDLLAETPLFQNAMAVSEIDLQKLAIRRQQAGFGGADGESIRKIPFSLNEEVTALTRKVAAYPFVPSSREDIFARCEEILTIQAAALARRIGHIRAKMAVVGLSGGLDSTLALLVMVRAMDKLGRPRSDILAVTMPCFGTTSRTKGNAQRLAEAYGVSFSTVDITAAVKQHFSDIGHDPKALDVTYENAQARERTQVLMDIANRTGGLVVGTGDLSELALGWATYNGDHMSMYGVNGSVPKTLIRHMVAYEAAITPDETLRQTLNDILATPVSPELLPAEDGAIAQKTEDLVGPYALHDFFLYYTVRWGFSPGKIFRLAQYAFGAQYDRAVIKKWLVSFYRRFFSQQFKRSCLPDGPKVGSVSLSPRGDWQMPSDAHAAIWLGEAEKL